MEDAPRLLDRLFLLNRREPQPESLFTSAGPFPSRVAAVVPPCSLHGVTLTIRKFNAKYFGIEDLIRIGTITEGLADILETAVVNRQNILISGGTSTCGTLAISLC